MGGKSGEAWGSKVSNTILKLGNKLKLEPGVVVEINRLIISGPNIQIKEKLAREYEVEGEFLLRSTDGYNYNKQREECAKYGDILDKIVINAVGEKKEFIKLSISTRRIRIVSRILKDNVLRYKAKFKL